MAVANRMGIPVDNVSEAPATGTMSGRAVVAEGSNVEMEEERTGEGPDR